MSVPISVSIYRYVCMCELVLQCSFHIGVPTACVYAHTCKSATGNRLSGVSIAGGLWLLRSDYIGENGEVSRLVNLSVFCVAD